MDEIVHEKDEDNKDICEISACSRFTYFEIDLICTFFMSKDQLFLCCIKIS
jgi:hypothetical protein